ENRAGGFAPPWTADEKTFAPGGEREHGQEHIAGVTLPGWKGETALAVAQDKRLRRTVVEFDVVMRADDGGVDDPEVGLAQLLIQRRSAAVWRVSRSGDRTAVQVCHIERPR